MKLAEALLERKNLNTRLDDLQSRAIQNARVQEGDAPAEDPTGLLRELSDVVTRMGTLISQINATNNVTALPNGVTVSNAIVQRDMLDLRYGALNYVLSQAAIRQDRATRTEIRFVSAVNVTELRREADELARARRELDAAIQSVNWTADLVE